MKLGATADKEVVEACVLMCCGAKALTPEMLELKASKRAMDETRILRLECGIGLLQRCNRTNTDENEDVMGAEAFFCDNLSSFNEDHAIHQGVKFCDDGFHVQCSMLDSSWNDFYWISSYR
jgi:hypothetical protein